VRRSRSQRDVAARPRLLAAEADVNAPGAKYKEPTALQAVAAGDHLEVVKRLLAAKADVNALSGAYHGPANRGGAWKYTRALQAAANGGHLKVVGVLEKVAGAISIWGVGHAKT